MQTQQQSPRFHDLELDNIEQTLETFETSIRPDWDPDEPDDGQLHEMQADFLADMVSSCEALTTPIADERQIHNFNCSTPPGHENRDCAGRRGMAGRDVHDGLSHATKFSRT